MNEFFTSDFRFSLGIVAGLVHLAGYIAYAILVWKKVIEKPNPASWLIWTFGSTLNFLSFFKMTGGMGGDNTAENIMPFVCSVSCIIFFLFAIRIGSFEKICFRDWLLVVADIAIVVFWYKSQSADYANILFQVSTFASFWPMFRDMKAGKDKEHQLPWLFWSIAYAIEGVVVFTAPDPSAWTDTAKEMAYPVVCFICHATVWKLALSQQKTARPSK